MVKITVCIGSSCHLKGSRQVVEELQALIAKHGVANDVDLSGTFCMGNCSGDGVSVTLNGEYFAVKPETVSAFFEENVLKTL